MALLQVFEGAAHRGKIVMGFGCSRELFDSFDVFAHTMSTRLQEAIDRKKAKNERQKKQREERDAKLTEEQKQRIAQLQEKAHKLHELNEELKKKKPTEQDDEIRKAITTKLHNTRKKIGNIRVGMLPRTHVYSSHQPHTTPHHTTHTPHTHT